MSHFAIIGGGIAGLSCGSALRSAGHKVTVFDEGKAPGGRTTTKKQDAARYDAGAPWFQVQDSQSRFSAEVVRWEKAGLVAKWTGKTKGDVGERYVGVPGMNAIARDMSGTVTLRWSTRVGGMTKTPEGWSLTEIQGEPLGVFDAVVLAIPAPDARALLGDHAFAQKLSAVEFAPAWSVMATFDKPISTFDACAPKEGPIALAVSEKTKPQRPTSESWVLHATSEWSTAHRSALATQVAAKLIAAFTTEVGSPLKTTELRAHRWEPGRVTKALGESFLFDEAANLSVCGDGCLGGTVEQAWLSGALLAERLQQKPASAE